MSALEVTSIEEALRRERATAPAPVLRRYASLVVEANPRIREPQENMSFEITTFYHGERINLAKNTSIEHRVTRMILCSEEERKLTWMRQKRIWLFIIQMELKACRNEYH